MQSGHTCRRSSKARSSGPAGVATTCLHSWSNRPQKDARISQGAGDRGRSLPPPRGLQSGLGSHCPGWCGRGAEAACAILPGSYPAGQDTANPDPNRPLHSRVLVDRFACSRNSARTAHAKVEAPLMGTLGSAPTGGCIVFHRLDMDASGGSAGGVLGPRFSQPPLGSDFDRALPHDS